MATQKREKQYVKDRIEPTVEQVLAAAARPDHSWLPKGRTMTQIGEQIITDAGYDFNYNAAGGYMPSNAQNLNAQVKMAAVKRIVEQAVADGALVEITPAEARNLRSYNYGVSSLSRLYLTHGQYERMVERAARIRRNAQRDLFLKQAQAYVLGKYAHEVQREHDRLAQDANISPDYEEA